MKNTRTKKKITRKILIAVNKAGKFEYTNFNKLFVKLVNGLPATSKDHVYVNHVRNVLAIGVSLYISSIHHDTIVFHTWDTLNSNHVYGYGVQSTTTWLWGVGGSNAVAEYHAPLAVIVYQLELNKRIFQENEYVKSGV